MAETVECMEELRGEGLIRHWGVSNFDVEDMDELMDAWNEVRGCRGVHAADWSDPADPADPSDASAGGGCMTDQVLYHLGSRGVEVALKPWMAAHAMPMMAYCPLAQGGSLVHGLLDSPAVAEVARRHGASAAQVLLAWVMRDGRTIAIPKAATAAHARNNAGSADLVLSKDDLGMLDAAFPAPSERVPLDWL